MVVVTVGGVVKAMLEVLTVGGDDAGDNDDDKVVRVIMGQVTVALG
jgi:hypothetical protein